MVVSGIGEVKAVQDADLTFATTGTVDQVLVEEGDTVQKGELLAILDTRSLDQAIAQAEASLDIAKASEDALNEGPTSAEVSAANVQIRQAQITLEQTKTSEEQNLLSAQSGLSQAQASLQSTKDSLSQAKTNAEAQLKQSALSLTQAQAAYAQAKSDWDYVQDTGANPTAPKTTDSSGNKVKNKLEDSQRAQYYAAFVQAEASMKQAEETMKQAEVNAEKARQAEVTGIQQAEETVKQAQARVDTLKLPDTADQTAAAKAAVDLAQANKAKLNPAPSKSDVSKASATVRQAQAALDSAKVNREHAEIHAPFAGIISEVNIDPGDPSSSSGSVPISIVDVSQLHVDVDINDVDIAKVKLGQKAQLVAQALPDTIFSGSVTYIAPTATVSGNVRTYVVRIKLDKQDGLRPGMRIRVTILDK